MIKKISKKIAIRVSRLFILSSCFIAFLLGIIFMIIHVGLGDNLFFEVCSYFCMLYMLFMAAIACTKISLKNEEERKEQNEFFQKLKDYTNKHGELEVYIDYNERMNNYNDLYDKIVYFVAKEELIRFYISMIDDDKIILTLKSNEGEVLQQIKCSKEGIVRNFILKK